MKWEREEQLLRELDERMPPLTSLSDEFIESLEGVARLSGLIREDVDNALRGNEREMRYWLNEIGRKADVVNGWLLRKARECREEGECKGN